MNPLFKIAAVAAPALLMLACGGGGGSAPAASTAGGGVSKGIIIGGEVNIYSIEAGEVSATPLTSPVLTDANGQYSIIIPSSNSGSPILLRLSMAQDAANAVTTQMKCDLPAGCGTGTDFGDLYTPDASFVMEAILASGSGQISAAITPLTDIGAKLAKARLEAGDGNDVAATVIDFANSQVANRFGLSGSLTDQEIVDITDPVAANTASKDALRNSALAAAIVAAVQNEQPGQTIEQALITFVSGFVANGVADKDSTPDTTTTTLAEVLEQAKAALAKTADAIEEEYGEDGGSTNFSSAQTEVQNDQDDASGDNASTVASQGSGSPNAGTAELAKTKAFVQQLRDLGGNLEAGLEDGAAAAEQINMIAELNQDDVDEALESTADSVTAIVEAYIAYDEANEEKPTSFTSDNNIVVAISVSGDKQTFTIDQAIGEQGAIDLVGVVDLTESENEGDNPGIGDDVDDSCSGAESCEGSETNTGTINIILRELSLLGDVTSGNATMSILDTTDINGSASGTSQESFEFEQNGSNYDDEYRGEFNGSGRLSINVDVQLTVTAEQATTLAKVGTAQASEVTFVGGLSASLTGFQINDVERGVYSQSGDSNTYEEDDLATVEFDLATLGLTGSITDDLGNRASATINITVDGRNAEVTESYTYSETSGSNSFISDENYENSDEDENNFVTGTIAVTLVADINGISDHTKVEFDAAREEFDTGTLSLRVEYGVAGDDDARLAQHIDIQGEATDLAGEPDESTDLTVTNQDGVEASLSNPDDELSGTIVFNGTTYATITPKTIRYIDGTIESF